VARRTAGRTSSNVTQASTSSYKATPEELAMRQWLAPIPRERYATYTDKELADEVRRLFMLKRAQMSQRILLDMRLLRWYDPQWIGDTWADPYSGALSPKLRHNSGLATENVPWSTAIVEALVGLLSGNKPMAYTVAIEPEDAASDADILQADMLEKYIDRWVEENDYDLTYMDHIANVISIGRSWKMVTTDPDTLETSAEILWPGHVAAFWQTNNRIVEQVTVERQLTMSEAFDMYGTSPENRRVIEEAVKPPASNSFTQVGGTAGRSNANRQYSGVTVLTHWYRMGKGRMGVDPKTINSDRPDPMIGMCAVLLYNVPNQEEHSSFMLARYDTTTTDRGDQGGLTGYEDVPLQCTPRFKIMDKPPDESFGVLMQVSGLHRQYNEVFSAYRDMLWRTIYARYVAKGFTFRNAPKIIPGSAIYALPRTDQDFKRIEEAVNIQPIDSFLANLEKLVVVIPGLNHYFLGSAPPSETSGESITAAINASVTRIEPWRTNIQKGEKWTYRQVLAQSEAYHRFTYEGRTITMASLIEGKRQVFIHWRDVTPRDAEKAKRMALEGVQAGVVSRDTAMDEWSIHSKADERRKIRKERQDIVLSPTTVLQVAQARQQLAQLQSQPSPGAQGTRPGQSGGPRLSLTAKLTPQQEEAAAAMAGLGGGQPPQGGGGGQTPPGQGGGAANAAARVSAAQAAPKGTNSMNRGQGGAAGGRMARTVAPVPPGQQPAPPPLQRR